jgi:hypothetical protein
VIIMASNTNKMGTLSTTVKIDVSPEGVTFVFNNLDSDIAKLIQSAKDIEVIENEYQTYESSNLVLRTKKALGFVDREPTPPTEG